MSKSRAKNATKPSFPIKGEDRRLALLLLGERARLLEEAALISNRQIARKLGVMEPMVDDLQAEVYGS